MERKAEADALDDAQRWLNSAKRDGSSGDYNLGIYGLEMSVEIALKAVLIFLGIDYPKVHDILPVVRMAIKENKSRLPKSFVENESFILDTFKDLLKLRGPAGYTFGSNVKIMDLEEDYKKYLGDATKILELCKTAITVSKKRY
ncbi:MAG: HEPN domain-containing protein [Candidatus Nanoarchaeia archaeon]|nr:HEPN domain-containing protein [Candidatus Jingweiarchaeum tengchongense]